MSHFYGTCQGGRGMATRCGHKSTGLTVSAKTWGHHVDVSLNVGPEGDDWVHLSVSGRTLFYGPLHELFERVEHLREAIIMAELVRKPNKPIEAVLAA